MDKTNISLIIRNVEINQRRPSDLIFNRMNEEHRTWDFEMIPDVDSNFQPVYKYGLSISELLKLISSFVDVSLIQEVLEDVYVGHKVCIHSDDINQFYVTRIN